MKRTMKVFMRRMISAAAALALLLALCVPSFAANCQVMLSGADATLGEEFSVSVSVSAPTALATLRLSYDTEYLQYVSGGFSGGSGSVTLDYEYESIGTGTAAFSVCFKALKTGSTTVSVSECMVLDGTGAEYTVSAGTASVTIRPAHTPGDMNGDNSVNNRDALALFRYVSGVRSALSVPEEYADVNGDHAVNNRDALLLFRYVSGIPVVLS